MKLPIPYGHQHIDDDDIQAVVETLRSDFLTQGPKVREFEKAFAEYCGARYAVAVANGTAALHLSTLAMEAGPGQKVITTPITFAASANCVRYCGGEVLFADIDPATYLIDLNQVESILQKEKNVTGVIPVDFAGYPVNLEDLKALAQKFNLWIIEDACHSPGAYFIDSKGEKIFCGAGKYADISVFSFHPVKHIATGEGGMAVTNSEKLYNAISLLRTHGITKDPNQITENHGGWSNEMVRLGFNYRLSDIQAALGISQLKKLEDNINRRQKLAQRYIDAFKTLPIKTPAAASTVRHAYHLFVIETDRRKELYEYLKARQIMTQVHYGPVHLHPYYRNLGWKEGDFPAAENYYKRCLSLPLYHSLTDEQQEYVIESVTEFFKKG